MIRQGRPWILTALIGVVVLQAGCQRNPLAPGDMPRTPYSRYQALRGEEPPMEVEDTFGRPQKNLRARLAPLDRP